MSNVAEAGRVISKHLIGRYGFVFRLADAQKNWWKVVGPLLASRTSLFSCDFSNEEFVITINVTDGALLPAVMSRRAAFVKVLQRVTGVEELSVRFKIGRVVKPSSAKDPLPEYMRRKPVKLTDEEVSKAADMLEEAAGDRETAVLLARLRRMGEKLRERRA